MIPASGSPMAKRDLGWEPKVQLEEGLGRTLDYFRTHPELAPS